MINIGVHAGASRELTLARGVILYQDAAGGYATVHRVARDEEGRPTLLPGRSTTPAFLRALGRSLQGSLKAELLPERVVCRTPGMVAWWTPASHRVMFWRDDDGPFTQVDGRVFPQPPLLWRYAQGTLSVRALKEERHPAADTRLFVAPYLNVGSTGRVCMGTMPRPKGPLLECLDAWVASFFGSAFTHADGSQRLTLHPGGLIALYAQLVGADAFPLDTLVDAGESVTTFLNGR